MSDTPGQAKPEEQCGNSASRTGRSRLPCVRPKGHPGVHRDVTGCWWENGHNLYAERFRKVLAEKLDAKLVEMAAGPTPRPWKLDDDETYLLAADGAMVADVHDGLRKAGTDKAIAVANAKLILRCVNGYDILADALKQLLISASCNDVACQILAVLDKAGAL